MADSNRGGWFRRRDQKGHSVRVLTAAATRLKIDDRKEARVQRAMRQGWQSEAWAYRDSIGELRYAVNFMANCAARMRLYPAAYPTSGDTDNPVPLAELSAVPPAVAAACAQAIKDLGDGKLAVSGLLHALSTNYTVAGECYLLGMSDPQTGEETWTIRSIDEIVISEDRYRLRETPNDPNGAVPAIDLDPDFTVVSRIWQPHPRFRLLADSPLRAIMDDCESLMILRRMIRATGRSRLAGRGMLLVPDELSIKVPIDDNADPEADPFMGALAEAMMEPIGDEGVASAVVPIVIRGPGDTLDQVRHVDFASQFDEQSSKTREEMIGVIATGLDIPKEIIAGMADLNHWTAWQVDDNTFRHHVEPHVIACCDALTGAYLRPYLEANDCDPEWVQRLVLWYDPTELVTHPDQTADAISLHDRLVISDDALLKTAGFGETEKPTKQEIQLRMLHAMRMWPPNLVMAFLHAWDPTLVAPAITESGTIPGINLSGVDTGEIPPPGGTQGTAPSVPLPAAPSSEPPAASNGPTPAAEAPTPAPPPQAVAAAGKPALQRRQSEKLAHIDRDLRSRLQTAANAAMLRQLEKAGARLRTKVAKDETSRTKIAHQPIERAAAILGEQALAASGITAQELMGGDWSGLKSQFHEWTEAAQEQAIAAACRIGHLDSEDDAAVAAKSAMSAGREAAWSTLENALTNLGHHLLYNPHPDATGAWADLNPDTLVPTGMIRAVLAVAGGASADAVAAAESGALSLLQPIGQIGTGATVEQLLTTAGAEQQNFEWVHGPSLNPFQPHEDLDGVEFENFDDDALQNTEGWPDNAYFMPGDHDGCTCDFMPMWASPSGD